MALSKNNLSKMKQIVTIFCCGLFAAAGIALAIATSHVSSRNYGYNTMSAAVPTITAESLPKDLLLDFAKKEQLNSSVPDTVYLTKTDTIKEQVTKVKFRRIYVPKEVVKTDTLHVPVYYLATRTEERKDSVGQCIPVYEVRKVDEICP